jgi:hypothetical protein
MYFFSKKKIEEYMPNSKPDLHWERLFYFIIILLLFIVFFGFLFIQTDIFKYRIVKKYINDIVPSYDENQEKYKHHRFWELSKDGYQKERKCGSEVNLTPCMDICKRSVCEDYGKQVIKYEMCKKCNSKGLCYDPFGGDCEKCLQMKSCEEIYGCDGGPPKDPKETDCIPCYGKIY